MSRDRVPPVTCHEWCRHGDNHPDEVHRQDQVCQTVHQVVGTRLMPMWKMSDGSWYPPELEVFAEAGPETPDKVVLYCQDPDFQLDLRPNEARLLVELLNNQLGQLDWATDGR